MMTTLGNKKNVKIFSFALAGVFIASVAVMAVVSMGDTANAAPTSDIGVVDQREVISSNGQLALNYQQKMKETEKDMEDQVTGAVKSVASKKGLSLVVDKSAVIYGGTDITKDVSDTLNKSISASQSAAASQSK